MWRVGMKLGSRGREILKTKYEGEKFVPGNSNRKALRSEVRSSPWGGGTGCERKRGEVGKTRGAVPEGTAFERGENKS